MSTDARLNTGLPTHPKTKKLIRRLGPGAGWSLVCLILWARANRPDGDLSGMSDEDIELASDWAGENDAFVAALVTVGFLDGDSGCHLLHDWSDHQPWSAGSEARTEKARFAALCKQHGRSQAAKLMPEYAARLLESATKQPEAATSKLVAVPNPASSTQKPVSSSAPSPSPSPSPSPEQELESPNGDLSPAPATPPAGDLLGDPDEGDQPGRPPCPVQRIVSLYHECLPQLARVRAFPEQSAKMLKSRWREDVARQNLDWWRKFFVYVGTCPFLVGGKTDFTADLMWLVRPTNFAKVINGNYQARDAA